MALTSFSTDPVDFVVTQFKTTVRIHPWRSSPPGEHERRRWDIHFINYTRMDVTRYLQELVDDGYRLSKETAEQLAAGKPVSFVATKSLLIVPCLSTRSLELESKAYSEDLKSISNMRDVMLLAKQRENPASFKGQAVAVSYRMDSKSPARSKKTFHAYTLCTEDTIEEHLKKQKCTLVDWWLPSFEELTASHLSSALAQYKQDKKHKVTVCKLQKHQCSTCRFLFCIGRRHCTMSIKKPQEQPKQYRDVIDILLDEKH